MTMCKVQFQKGMSMTEFQELYGTEAQCEDALLLQRWPSGFVCPVCGGKTHRQFRRSGLRYFQCSGRNHQTSLIAKTLFASSKLSLRSWFQALFVLTQTKNNVAALELKRVLGVCYRTAWRIKHKLMGAMAQQEESRVLGGKIEVDDAYLGGECMGSKPGRGSPNKQAFVIAVNTHEGRPQQVVMKTVSSFTKAHFGNFLKQHVAPGSDVYSDGLAAFSAAETHNMAHTVFVAESPRLSAKNPQMKWVNTVLSNVKRSMDGTYHSIDVKKYGQQYLYEAAWRFNRRKNLASLPIRLLRHAIASLPRPESFIRNPQILPC